MPPEFWDREDVLDALAARDMKALFVLLRQWVGASQMRIAMTTGLTPARVGLIMRGAHAVEKFDLIERIAEGLAMPDQPRLALGLAPHTPGTAPLSAGEDDETASLELARRIAASDVGETTLTWLEQAADDLAMAYARTPPRVLLPQVRRYLRYVDQLLDARKTLAQQRRLLIVSGWFTLIAATLHIDLRQRAAVDAELMTAFELARHADFPEIAAWSLETRAWDALTDGQFRLAADLSQQAQAAAPESGSAYIQATAQEGRAHARMGNRRETLDALDRTARLASPLGVPDSPEHHYRYDPGKALAYIATTLSWLGDPAAVTAARDVVAQLRSAPDGVSRPRRIASAQLDLALALLAAGEPDEAAALATAAITTGLLVPSNWWRATEILTGAAQTGTGAVADLRDAWHAYHPGSGRTH